MPADSAVADVKVDTTVAAAATTGAAATTDAAKAGGDSAQVKTDVKVDAAAAVKTDAVKTDAAKTPGSLLEAAGADDAKADATKTDVKTDAAKSQGAPETYTDFKLPDGLTPDAKLMDSFKALAKAKGLSQETAQEFVTMQAEHAKSTAESLVAQAEQQRATQIEAWQAETKKALGAEWKKELGFAGKALDAFWPPEFRKMLTASGLGDHPQMVAGLVALGKKMSEAKPGEGSRVGIVDPKEAGHRSMFPKMYDGSGNYIGGAK